MEFFNRYPVALIAMIIMAVAGIVAVSLYGHDSASIITTVTVLSALILGLIDRQLKQNATDAKIDDNTRLTKQAGTDATKASDRAEVATAEAHKAVTEAKDLAAKSDKAVATVIEQTADLHLRINSRLDALIAEAKAAAFAAGKEAGKKEAKNEVASKLEEQIGSMNVASMTVDTLNVEPKPRQGA